MRDRLNEHLFGRYIVLPTWDAIVRLSQPDVRIVTGGIAFYTLFSVIPLIYMVLTLAFVMLPSELSADLAQSINRIIATNVVPLDQPDLNTVEAVTPRNLTLKVALALILVFWAASAGTKALITGIRMIAHATQSSGLIRFQGISFLLTSALILLVWLLGGVQILLTIVRNQEGGLAADFTREIATLASTLWITKWIAVFLFFYLILAVSLSGRVSKGWPMIAGSASAAVTWMGATFLFQLYLKYSTLDTLYGALASVIIGFIWLAVSVNTLLFGAALASEWDDLSTEDAEAS